MHDVAEVEASGQRTCDRIACLSGCSRSCQSYPKLCLNTTQVV
jgi:hypothetical protein